jgi:hypothetical protein
MAQRGNDKQVKKDRSKKQLPSTEKTDKHAPK